MTAPTTLGNISNANFPMDPEGRTYHLALKKGELANYIVTVGDFDRARLIVKKMETIRLEYLSGRGFLTFTGTYKGLELSVVAIGMGIPMMDFFVREARAVVEGDMYIIRLGSCGTPRKDIEIRTVVVANQSFAIVENPDAFRDPSKQMKPYSITQFPARPEFTLHQLFMKKLKDQNTFPVIEAEDITAPTFYAAQGRIDAQFKDLNEHLIEMVSNEHPNTGSLQMETFCLFDLAEKNKMAQTASKIHAAGCAIVLANRPLNQFLSHEEKHKVEIGAGVACFETFVESSLQKKLWQACGNRDSTKVLELLKQGVKPDTEMLIDVIKEWINYPNSPSLEIIAGHLISYGASFNQGDWKTAIEYAKSTSKEFRTRLAQHFCDDYACQIESYPQKLPLTVSIENLRNFCKEKKVEQVKEILNQHPNLGSHLKDLLFIAIEKNYIDLIDLLLEHKAPINAIGLNGMTALKFAAGLDNLEAYEILAKEARKYPPKQVLPTNS